MIITICSSLDFIDDIKQAATFLESKGHTVLLPHTAELILKGDVTAEQVKGEKNTEAASDRIIRFDAIRFHQQKIAKSDAIVVINKAKKNIEGYVGGAVFLEIGFAHILHKKVFLLNEVPDVSYRDEILGMQPTVLHGDLSLVE